LAFFFFFFRQKFSQKLSQTCYWDCVKSIFNTSKTLSGKKNVDLKKIKNLKKLLFCSKNKLENENKTISSFFYKQKLAPRNRCGCGNRLGYLDFDASFLFIFLVKNTISKHSYILYYIIHFLLLFKQKIHYKIKFFSFFHTTKIKYYTNHLYLL
jgi:hypothetical protein